ncbi:DNA-binding protein [Hymenobacter wooponensis]|uniref:DNA-binding protein n=1 Tax=Hymenobacter wooponensis TaxID=1525360 RepID=A0A4Z0MP66_9BACT|nr:DNA-binding protein [Hymenobacter wooponensis]TGD81672.1 DNA-binding protein [Hymenobacter wooponensis]
MIFPVEELRLLGNKSLLELPRTAFFCSRNYPVSIERATYLWALEQRMHRRCVLSSFHSQLEQSVFRYLRQEPKQPILYALGRGIQPSLSMEYSREIELGHLLFLSRFDEEVKVVTPESANLRNLLMVDMADELFIPYVRTGGNLERLLTSAVARFKPLLTLDLPANRPLLQRGARIYRPQQLVGHLGRHWPSPRLRQ